MRMSFHFSIIIILFLALTTGCNDGYSWATGKGTTVSHIPPDDFNRFASSIVDMPQQGQDEIEELITANTGGVVRFRKTGVMQTLQYEVHVPPNALSQDGRIGIGLKDTYGQGFALDITSSATFTIDPRLHCTYILDISLAEVLGYDLNPLLEHLGEPRRVSDAMPWPRDVQILHDTPLSSTPINQPALDKLGLYHYDTRYDRWESKKPYVEVNLIRTVQNRRYLYIYAYTRMSEFSLYALGGAPMLIRKDADKASMPTRLVRDLPGSDSTEYQATFIPQNDSLQ